MLNRVMLIGNLGADPEIRYLPNGNPVATISLATTRRWKNKDTGERKEETEWHRVVFFKNLAEIVGEYLKKGSQIYVEGRIRTNKWQGSDGQDRYMTEIIAENMSMLGRREGGGGPQVSSYSGQENQMRNNSQSLPGSHREADQYDAFDDDIPF